MTAIATAVPHNAGQGTVRFHGHVQQPQRQDGLPRSGGDGGGGGQLTQRRGHRAAVVVLAGTVAANTACRVVSNLTHQVPVGCTPTHACGGSHALCVVVHSHRGYTQGHTHTYKAR